MELVGLLNLSAGNPITKRDLFKVLADGLDALGVYAGLDMQIEAGEITIEGYIKKLEIEYPH
jgi:hypothetical protein